MAMEDGTTGSIGGRVAEVRFKTETPNRLDAAARSRIAEALREVFADDGVAGVVLSGPDGRFPTANDPGGEGPSLSDLCALIEGATKPVAAAIAQGALGPGCDVALAAHFRFAAEKAVLGYPEVRLGLVPEAGGSQRLPRLVGAAAALEVLLSGRAVPAPVAAKTGMIDGAVADDPVIHAVRYIQERAAAGGRPEPTRRKTRRLRDAGGYLAACRARREAVDEGHLTAPRRMIDCVEAALLLPFDEGLAFEAETRAELLNGAEARALAHISRAEAMRIAPKSLREARPREVETVGIVGAGRIGTELSLAALAADFSVVLCERDEARLEEAVLTIIEATDAEVEAGRLKAEDGKARIARLAGAYQPSSLSEAGFLIEALSDAGDGADTAIAALDGAMKAGAVLALTDTGADLAALAASTSRAPDILGLRVFPPLRRFRAAELRQGKETSVVAGATAWDVLKRLGRLPVISAGGAVSDALAAAYHGAADWCLMAGAGVEEVDRAMRNWGARLGPFEARDLAGGGRVGSALPGGLDKALWQAGKRYYSYRPNGSRAGPDPGIEAILDAARKRGGFVRRPVEAEEIVARCLTAMANAGAKAVRERRVARPAEIDMLAVHGLGLPRWRGGPLVNADIEGLLRLEKRLKRFSEDVPALWTPDPLVGTLVKNGKRFGSLNG